ncbi:MAG TPA: DnaJ family domain-containing protein [Thermoanaerobaculia bacterium]|nr:DnaJ family domain-containing protein [Thermoanaerobaculia bacterium]
MRTLAENRIREAMDEGLFDHLEGAGRPLPAPAPFFGTARLNVNSRRAQGPPLPRGCRVWVCLSPTGA